MPTVQLLARDNGFGLSRSQRLLADALNQVGYEVIINGKDARCAKRRRKTSVRLAVAARQGLTPLRRQHRYDINIMLEHVWPESLHEARRNIYMPNPEWVDRHDLRYLRCFDLVLGKTQDAVDIFQARGVKGAYMGFISEDRHDPDVPRETAFFHLAGGALIKGTERLMEVWRKHPEWPLLTVLQDPRRARPGPTARNIAHRIEYLDVTRPEQRAEMSRLQNSHLFHICPSETDTWGHYIGEGLGVGALMLATNAPPMTEMVQPDRGLLIDYSHTGRRGLATTYYFDEKALVARVEEAIHMPTAERDARRQAARQWLLAMRESFPARVAEAMAQLPA